MKKERKTTILPQLLFFTVFTWFIFLLFFKLFVQNVPFRMILSKVRNNGNTTIDSILGNQTNFRNEMNQGRQNILLNSRHFLWINSGELFQKLERVYFLKELTESASRIKCTIWAVTCCPFIGTLYLSKCFDASA